MSSRHAVTSQPIHPLLTARQSTRAFDPDGKVSEQQLTALLEAARWAPSAGNTQPSRFIVGRRGSEVFEQIFDSLRPGNQGWTRHSALLIVGVRLTSNEKGPLSHSAYDLGQSMAHLTMQVLSEGLTIRQMAGFDPEKVREDFELADHLEATSVAAIGVAGDPAQLPDDLRGPDDNPRVRKPLNELVLAE